MSAIPIERRLAALEAEVARLRVKLAKVELTSRDKLPWWQAIAGTFENDPIYEEAMRLGREWRESFRPKSRRRRKK